MPRLSWDWRPTTSISVQARPEKFWHLLPATFRPQLTPWGDESIISSAGIVPELSSSLVKPSYPPVHKLMGQTNLGLFGTAPSAGLGGFALDKEHRTDDIYNHHSVPASLQEFHGSALL